MSLPKPNARTCSIDALPPQGHLLTPWHGETSPISSSSSACSTPLEKQLGDMGVLGIDLGLLAIADGDESINVPHTDIGQDQAVADELPNSVRVETIDASYESEYEDEGDEWYQPKGGLIVTTPHKPSGSGKPATGSAVGKPSAGTGPKK